MRKLTIIFTLLTAFAASCFAKGESSREKADVKIVAEVKNSGYCGEVFEYTVTLKSTTQEISNVNAISLPAFPDDVKVIKGLTSNSRPESRKEGGKTYYCWTVLRYFLIPEKAGKFSVGPAKFLVYLPDGSTIIRDFWGPRKVVEYAEKTLECKAVSFRAKALPNAPKDAEFSGCVGDFTIEGWFPPGKIYTGTDAYVIFEISGRGSLEGLKLPNISKLFSKGCRLKEIDQNEEKTQKNGQLYTQVTLTCRFVAEEDEFEIDPLCVTFFSPDEKKYYEVCSEKLHKTESTTPRQPSRRGQTDAFEI